MKKITIAILLLLAIIMQMAADEPAAEPEGRGSPPVPTVTLEFPGVKINGGIVYVAVYDSAEAYKKEQACRAFMLEPVSQTVSIQTSLNEGYYRIMAYQDENGNGRLDTVIFGIPIEPIGISNYSGRGIPGNFEKLKLWIGQGVSRVIVNLAYYR